MDYEGSFLFSRWCKAVHKKNVTTLCNTQNGIWVTIPDDIYSIIAEAADEFVTLKQLEEYFNSEEDFNQVKQIIETLYENKLLCHSENEYNVDLKDVQLAITNKCNLKCTHCCYKAGEKDSNDEMDAEEWKALIDELVKTPVDKICLTGGEPLIRKDFWEIVDYIRSRYDKKLTLMTNGTLIHAGNAEKIAKNFDDINISIDGVNENTCTPIRGKGVFSRVIEAVHFLKDQGAKSITLSMVLTSINNEEEKFRELCRMLGVHAMVRIFSPIGRGFENKNELWIDYTKEENKKETKGITADSLRCRTCKAGMSTLHIDYEGSIYPCGSIIFPQFRLGNIKEIKNMQSFLEDMRNNPGYINLQKSMPENGQYCKDCEVSLFCHTCPGVYFGMLLAPDILKQHCMLSKNNFMELIWETEGEECKNKT